MEQSGKEIQTPTEEENSVKETNIQQGSGIRCTKCDGKTHVKNSVPLPNESIMRRYRECDDCGARFMTEEVIKRQTVPRRK